MISGTEQDSIVKATSNDKLGNQSVGKNNLRTEKKKRMEIIKNAAEKIAAEEPCSEEERVAVDQKRVVDELFLLRRQLLRNNARKRN